MTELIELITESLPAAIGFAVVCFLIGVILKTVLKKQLSIAWLTICSLYIGFLLAGTLRPESVKELFHWENEWVMDVSWQLSLHEGISSLHGLFNIALFVPWGFLGMLVIKSRFAAPCCLLSCVAVTFFIETYQLFHRRSFDFGDIVTNLIGCIVGIVFALPIVICQKKRKR